MPTIVTLDMGGTGATHAAGARDALSVPSISDMGQSYAQANTARDQANTARDQANTARTQANTAYDQANTARTQANTAYGQANSARDQANTAYGQANGAYSSANLAYAQANSARSDANTTFATINTTFASTNTIDATQNTWISNLNSAASTINTSLGTINTNYQAAYAQANTARTTANDAYGAANTRLSASGGTLSGDLIITGNLTVSGNQTILNTEVLTTEDAEIILLSNTSSTPALNAGLIVNRGTSTNTFLRWDEALDEWGWSDSGTTTYYFEDLRQGLSTHNTTYATINTTFATLNTSAGTQNTAITTANDQANSARGQANTAYGQANSARDQANTAYGQANLAYAQANSARSDANTTFATVNTTFATINTTTATMNTATSNRVLKAGDTMTGNLTLSAASLVLSSTSNDQRLIDAEGTSATGRHVAFPLRFMIGSASSGYPFAGYNAIPRANGAYSYSTSDTAWGISYGNSSRMGFYYAASGTPGANISFSELMSITSGGSVGIGTAAPGTRLHVYQTTNDATIRLETTTAGSYFEARSGTDGYAGLVLVGAGSEKFFVGSYGVDALQFSRSRTGTEFMRITSGGNVGIGATAPQSRLEVNLVSGDNSSLMNANSVNDVALLRAPFGVNPASASNGQAKWGLRFVGRNDGTYDNGKSAAVYAVSEETAAGYNRTVGLAFHTSSFDASHTERMRITNSGNVGIGITSPGEFVHAYANSNSRSKIKIENINSGSSARAELVVNAYGNSWGIGMGAAANNSNAFYINEDSNSADTTRFTIKTGGNVGIGTTSPISKTTITRAVTNTVTLADSNNASHLTLAGSDALVRLQLGCGGVNLGYAGWIQASYDNTGGAFGVEPLLLNPSGGNVGIGTVSPSTKLHLYESGAADVLFRLTPANGTYDPLIQFTGQDNNITTEGFEIWYDNDVGDVHLSTTYPNDAATIHFHTRTGASKSTSNERLTILGNGNIGIANTAPAVRLQIGNLSSTSTSSPETVSLGGTFSSSAGGNPKLRIWTDGSNSIGLGVSSDQFDYIATGAYSHVFYQSGSERMRINSSGHLVPGANATYNLGSTSLRWSTVYTSDLDLSNGIGDWTIVEGEDDLFIYNNKRNKVYKFKLEEVDPATAVPKKENL